MRSDIRDVLLYSADRSAARNAPSDSGHMCSTHTRLPDAGVDADAHVASHDSWTWARYLTLLPVQKAAAQHKTPPCTVTPIAANSGPWLVDNGDPWGPLPPARLPVGPREVQWETQPKQECRTLEQECRTLEQECRTLEQECRTLEQECRTLEQECRTL
eukprot:gene545-3327_t